MLLVLVLVKEIVAIYKHDLGGGEDRLVEWLIYVN